MFVPDLDPPGHKRPGKHDTGNNGRVYRLLSLILFLCRLIPRFPKDGNIERFPIMPYLILFFARAFSCDESVANLECVNGLGHEYPAGTFQVGISRFGNDRIVP